MIGKIFILDMNTQNIFKSFGSLLDVKIDSSEYYDFDLAKTQNDYDTSTLNYNTPIQYDSLVIDESLENFYSNRNTITLVEVDNPNITGYTYSGLSITVDYNLFLNNFNTSGYSYSNIILNNNIYTYTGFPGEVHYFKIDKFNDPDPFIISFQNDFIDCENKIINESNCCSRPNKLNAKPWAYPINKGGGNDNCSFLIKRRTEEGWTLDFIFNRDGIEWSGGSIFYYFGVRGENDVRNYADNNLSFGFTNDGRIKWSSIHYSGYCETTSGYTENYYLASGSTPQLCVINPNKDFNLTITFKRNYRLEGCDLENEGGWNDLITGKTIISDIQSSITGGTVEYSINEILNKNWNESRNKRLGTLKVYLNGVRIYSLKNWEEIVPSSRGLQPFIQSWGGGTGLMGGIHSGVTQFNIKSIKYYEEPLDFLHIKHNFKTRLSDYDFEICESTECVDDVTGVNVGSIITQDDFFIYTQDDNRISYRS